MAPDWLGAKDIPPSSSFISASTVKRPDDETLILSNFLFVLESTSEISLALISLVAKSVAVGKTKKMRSVRKIPPFVPNDGVMVNFKSSRLPTDATLICFTPLPDNAMNLSKSFGKSREVSTTISPISGPRGRIKIGNAISWLLPPPTSVISK